MEERDIKIIKKIKKGNQQAFRMLYNRHADNALRTAYGITRNRSDAADVVQETFIKVFRNLDRFDMKRSFKPWFYQILINESRRLLQKRARGGISTDSDRLLDYLEQKRHEKKQDEKNLSIALEYLPEETRTLLVLKYVNSFTEKEIAKMLSLNQSTVKSRLYQARNKLKQCLGGVINDG